MTDLYQIPACRGLPEALALLASRQGRTVAPAGLIHGLSVDKGRLSPAFLAEAAARAGFALEEIDLRRVKPAQCPLLLAHADGRAVVITEIRPGGVGASLSETAETAVILLDSLKPAGFATSWSVRPLEVRDARTATAAGQDFSWFRDSLRISHDALGPVIAATVMINVLALAVPLISMNILDRVVAHAAFETLWALAIAGLGAVAADFALRTLRGTLIDRAAARSDVLLSNRIFSKVLGARLTAQQSSVGVKSNSLREYESLREIYNSATITTLGDLPFAVLFFFVIWLVAGPLVIVPLLVTPLLLLSGFLTQWSLNGLSKEHFKDTAHKNALAIEVLSGLETLKAHTAESWAAYKWEAAVAGHIRHSIAMRWWTALGSNTIIALQGLTTIAVLVVGVYLVVAGTISPGALFATIMLGGRSLTPVAQIASLIAKLHHAKTAYQAIKQLADVEQERPPGLQFLSSPTKLEPILFDGVGMKYRDQGPPALRNISLSIRPGEKIGIIGSIGSGKSSFLQLLLGLRNPTSGNITMAGLPVQQIDPIQYRRLFGTAFQEEAFFFGTIRENLSFHRPLSSEAEVVEAARLGGALNWIKTLPAGFATVISEQGRSLSSGQRQTLALSRAFLGKPGAIILDEPTSDLDARSEAEVVKRLKELPRENTLVVVSHRPAVLEACERVIVLDCGSIVMDGEKNVVMARLKQIVTSQRGAMGTAS